MIARGSSHPHTPWCIFWPEMRVKPTNIPLNFAGINRDDCVHFTADFSWRVEIYLMLCYKVKPLAIGTRIYWMFALIFCSIFRISILFPVCFGAMLSRVGEATLFPWWQSDRISKLYCNFWVFALVLLLCCKVWSEWALVMGHKEYLYVVWNSLSSGFLEKKSLNHCLKMQH